MYFVHGPPVFRILGRLFKFSGFDSVVFLEVVVGALRKGIPEYEVAVATTPTADSVSARRKAFASEKRRLEQIVDELFVQYAVDSTETLSEKELGALLKDLNAGRPVHASEVQFVLRCADVSGEGHIDRDSLRPALVVWTALRDDEQTIEARMLNTRGVLSFND